MTEIGMRAGVEAALSESGPRVGRRRHSRGAAGIDCQQRLLCGTMPARRLDSPPTSPSTPEVMTIDELAVYLQVSKSSLYKLAQDGRVPGQKVGRHWRFSKPAVDEWLRRGAKQR